MPNPNGTSDDDAYKCPGPDKHEFQLFPVLCTRHGECIRNIGNDYRCCKQFANRRCVKAEAKPIPEQMHQRKCHENQYPVIQSIHNFLNLSAALLWVIPRKCPREPLAELFWQVQTCNSDQDCWPRICCPDGTKKYCRTSRPELERLQNPIVRQLSYRKSNHPIFILLKTGFIILFIFFFYYILILALQSISGYIQCTPPPPPAYDKFPKKCNSTLECFPNVCCQEAGKKHCRPPRRSLLALVTGVAQVNTVLNNVDM